MASNVPRLVIAGLSGDSGKTIVSLSLLAAFRRKALAVSAFKKGPDYIDAAWLGFISGGPCRNLDTFMVDRERVQARFFHHANNSDVAIIEGNRGLYDGKDVTGTHSTAELAKLTGSPVILVVNCRKTTRTVAALVKGCQVMDPEVNIAGIILNNIAGRRHQQVITEAIRDYCNLPILGAIPKLKERAEIIPGRHLGLVTPAEHSNAEELRKILEEIAEKYLYIDAILATAGTAKASDHAIMEVSGSKEKMVKLGYFKDSVFTFYYPENLEALEEAGAELVALSSLGDSLPHDLDGLYIGGGFPETQADRLTENTAMMESVKSAADEGMPIYAECGGLIYLCRSLKWDDKVYRMTGVFPVDLEMHVRPVGHGYAELKAAAPNPYYEIGKMIRGHEFHYTRPVDDSNPDSLTMHVLTGTGIKGNMDGMAYKRVFACYTHTHSDGNSDWAGALIGNALKFKTERQKKTEYGKVTPLRDRATG